MQDATTVHQCPYCELKFLYANEVRDHVMHDHPAHAGVAESAEAHELPQR